MKLFHRLYMLMKNFPEYIKKGGVTYLSYEFSRNTDKLNNMNVIVTGGSSGIGYAIANACIEAGANVVIVGRNIEKLREANLKLGGNCQFIQHDIRDVKNSNYVIEKIKKMTNDKIDCLVNCAGVASEKTFFEVDEDDYDYVMDCCLKGTYFFSRAVFQNMIETHTQGRFVMISSNGSIIGHVTPYGYAKAGMNNFAVGLAKSGIKHGIRCNVVAPGYTCTAITKEFAKVNPDGNLYKDDVIDKRWHLAEEIAQVVVFLLSDDSSCINGQTIICDGGDTLV